MTYFTANMLLLVFAVMVGICQSSNDCFSEADHQAGKKCYGPTHTKPSCCTSGEYCDNGICKRIGATPPSKSLPLDASVLIGVGVSVLCIVCLITGAIYWHRRQMDKSAKRFNPLASFSQSQVSSRSGSSAGVRIRSTTSQPVSAETSLNLEPPSTTTA